MSTLLERLPLAKNGNLLASAGEETRIMLWGTKTGKLEGILSGHREFVNSLAFSKNGKLLASAGADDRILLWDVATGDITAYATRSFRRCQCSYF